MIETIHSVDLIATINYAKIRFRRTSPIIYEVGTFILKVCQAGSSNLLNYVKLIKWINAIMFDLCQTNIYYILT